MIISSLEGGLGNQMFQYACAREVSLKYNLPMKVVFFHSVGQSYHNGYELDRVFNLSAEVASKDDIINVVGFLMSINLIRKLYKKFFKKICPLNQFICEESYRYQAEVFSKINSKALLDGYWQTERYFDSHRKDIIKDFEFKVDGISAKNSELLELISNSDSVSIHVRRGDYLTNSKAKSIHGVCSEEYYFSAIRRILEEYPEAKLFAFSDDHAWVENTLQKKFKDITIVQNNSGINSHYDMYLMSQCKHNIIANSSFSWWGAWLNTYSEKIIIAPKNWFLDAKINTKDLIPESWLKL